MDFGWYDKLSKFAKEKTDIVLWIFVCSGILLFAPKIILDIKKELAKLGELYTEEIESISKENEFIKSKLTSIETKINRLGRNL